MFWGGLHPTIKHVLYLWHTLFNISFQTVILKTDQIWACSLSYQISYHEYEDLGFPNLKSGCTQILSHIAIG